MKRVELIGLAPLLIFMGVFLGLPLIAITRFSFLNAEGDFTLNNFSTISSGIYLDAFILSSKLSLGSALISLFLGFTFMFIAVLGSYGALTTWLRDLGVDIYGGSWTLYSFSGLLIVYLYFQIPLMVLISIPVLENIKPEWRDAAQSLGSNSLNFWRKVLIPILFPQLLGFFLLLFANSFAAYATAAALTSGSLALVPVQIASLIGSNVQVDGANTAMALGLGMVLLVGVSTVGYALLEKKASQWRR